MIQKTNIQNEQIIKAESAPNHKIYADKSSLSQLSFSEYSENKFDYSENKFDYNPKIYSSKSAEVKSDLEINSSYENEINYMQNTNIQADFSEMSRKSSMNHEKESEFGYNDISFDNISNSSSSNQFISSPTLRKSKFYTQRHENFFELPINQEDQIDAHPLENSDDMKLERATSIEIAQENVLDNSDSIQIPPIPDPPNNRMSLQIPSKIINSYDKNNDSPLVLSTESSQKNIRMQPSSHIIKITKMINNNLICKSIYQNIKSIVNDLLNNEYSKSKFEYVQNK